MACHRFDQFSKYALLAYGRWPRKSMRKELTCESIPAKIRGNLKNWHGASRYGPLRGYTAFFSIWRIAMHAFRSTGSLRRHFASRSSGIGGCICWRLLVAAGEKSQDQSGNWIVRSFPTRSYASANYYRRDALKPLCIERSVSPPASVTSTNGVNRRRERPRGLEVAEGLWE